MKINVLITFLLISYNSFVHSQSLNKYEVVEDTFCKVLPQGTAEIELYVHSSIGKGYYQDDVLVELYNDRITYRFIPKEDGYRATIIEAGRYNLRITPNNQHEKFEVEDLVFPSQRAIKIYAELSHIEAKTPEGQIPAPPPPPPDPHLENYEDLEFRSSKAHNFMDSFYMHSPVWTKAVDKNYTGLELFFYDFESKTPLENLEVVIDAEDGGYNSFRTNAKGRLYALIDPSKRIKIQIKSYNNNSTLKIAYCHLHKKVKGTLQSIEFFIQPEKLTQRREDALKLDSIRHPERYYQRVEVLKPIIYLYPTQPTDLTLALKVHGELTFSYPKYNNGWTCTAYPNGDIKIGEKTYPYLFWEGEASQIDPIIQKTGFVVKSEDIVSFLEEKLSYIGLNHKEMTDFITFWAPRLEQNAYNYLHFSIGEEYAKNIATLNLNVQPDAELHLHLFHAAVGPDFKVQSQELPQFERKGFTLVEWGGGPIQLNNNN